MGSMILSTSPKRRILQASQELAETVGCPSRLMAGLDCASLVRCRNADGKPLCRDLCPALRAARARAGTTVEVPVWIEDSSGKLTEYDASFQRIRDVSNGMVVACFTEPAEKENAEPTVTVEAPAEAAAPSVRKGRSRGRRAPARRATQLQLVSG